MTTRAKTKPKSKLHVSSSWDTTDDDEIIRRKIRSEAEQFVVEKLSAKNNYFSAFIVQAAKLFKHDNARHLVEIRSLVLLKNSCNCLDFKTNRLGTCKHIEHVLLTLESSNKQKFQKNAAIGSPWIEIYLDTRSDPNTIKIEWPKNISFTSKLYTTINKFFSGDDSLIGNANQSFKRLEEALTKFSPKEIQEIRVSTHIKEWLNKLKSEQQKNLNREIFLKDIAAGKRSFDFLKFPLYTYQQEGMTHLAFNERALLADEMGLGKTIQAIAACELLRQTKNIQRVLVVSTASLKAEWEEQIAKFSNLKTTVVQGSRQDRLRLYQAPSFFYLTNYEQILHDGADIQRLMAPDVIILDEAQRIKNWQTKAAMAIKRLESPYAFVLTGTPIENRIDDIYSIVQFLDPYLFGALFRFNREYHSMGESGRPIGYINLDKLHRKLKPILLRRRKSDVEDQLPERTVNYYFVAMHAEQRLRYEEYSTKVARLLAVAKRRTLRKEEMELLQARLACMRMLCDTPYIMDKACRVSPKLNELEKIFDELLTDESVKIIVFSEWEKMLELVKDLAEKMNIEYTWHTGSVPQKKRRMEINRFKNSPTCRLFLSTDAGSVGLNLQAANVVINVDLPWNPAKLEQRIARAWRKHQHRTVQVINLVCENSIEHRMISLLEQKHALAENILSDGEIKEMKIPSGRLAFIERLEELLDTPIISAASKDTFHKEIISEKEAWQKFTESTVDQCQKNLLSLQKHSRPQEKSAVVAVVKKADDDTCERIKQSLKTNQLDNFDLTLLDEKTQNILNHLAELGVITINNQMEQLFTAPKIAETQRKLQLDRVKKARKYLDQTARKFKMAELLVNGDFCQEALTPLGSAANAALVAYAYVHEKLPELNSEIATANLPVVLQQCPNFPPHFTGEIVNMQNDNTPSDSEIQNRLKVIQTIFNFVDEELNKIALS